MDKEIKNFIESHINEIENNEWRKIYLEINNSEKIQYLIRTGQFDLTLFNTTLLEAGIDPLNYLDFVPGRFLATSDFTKIGLPNHIKTISEYAFYKCQYLEDINLENIEQIWGRAFQGCKKLDSITLKDNLRLGEYAFSNAHIAKLYTPTHINYKADISAFGGCIIDNLYYDGTEQLFDGLDVESLFRDSKVDNIIFKTI